MIFLIVTVLIMPFLDIFVNCEFFLQFLHSYAKPVGMQASMEYCITVGIVTLTATILIHSQYKALAVNLSVAWWHSG